MIVLPIVVLSGFAASLLALVLRGRWAGLVLALVPAALFGVLLALAPAVAHGDALRAVLPWVPTYGVDFSFHLDGLALTMALLVTGIGALIFVYAGGYLLGDPQQSRFLAYLALFMAAMLGLVLAGNVFSLFVFWELTSITSFLLVGFRHSSATARAAAQKALIVTSAGGLALLVGLMLLSSIGGTTDIQALIAQRTLIQAHPLYPAALVLVLLGAFTKSAQFPFHFWLPGAMTAPTPASAYLHSATMVKAGVYLVARLAPALGGTTLWTVLLVGVGTATMVVGGLQLLHQTDLKRILAFATVCALGLLMLLLGVGGKLASEAMITFLVGHALYKAALFMVAGTVDHTVGTREIDRLGGLRRALPMTALAALVAALSLAGVPLLFGFIGKELVYEALLGAPGLLLVLGLALLANAAMTAGGAVVALRPFYGPVPPVAFDAGRHGANHDPAHEADHAPTWDLTIGAAVLAALGLAVGVLPGWVGETLIGPAASAIYGGAVEVHFQFGYGLTAITPMLLLSALTLVLGGVLALGHDRVRVGLTMMGVGRVPGPDALFERGVLGLPGFAAHVTRGVQSGHISDYLRVTLLFTVGLVGTVLLARVRWVWPDVAWDLQPQDALLGIAAVAAWLVAAQQRSRYAAVTALGVVGYSTALFFMMYSAPDLAMTQFAIETLSVFLFVLVVYRLPRLTVGSRRRDRWRDATVALLFGGLMTALMLVALAYPLTSRVAPFYLQNALPAARGENVVNVILVDFRGFDTLGEITVLAVAAIGVLALLRLRPAAPRVPAQPAADATPQPQPVTEDTPAL